jgi:hypothetical protein
VQFLLAEVYETTAGIDNHRRLGREDEDDSGVQALLAWAGKCDTTIGWYDADVVYSLW